jgi:Pyridoxamine 5'-phosphate oxidase
MTFSGKLSDLKRCFQGVVPSIITTSDGEGVPNVTFISHVYYVDEQHVALSCQFFNKTRKNLDENPLACVEVWEPTTLQAYQLHLRFLRSEKPDHCSRPWRFASTPSPRTPACPTCSG